MSKETAHSKFQRLAGHVLSQQYGVWLAPGAIPGIQKEFDLVSADGQLVGGAKYYGLSDSPPSGKLAAIAEYVWMLEHTGAPKTFLVFGNDRRVPLMWLDKHGPLLRRKPSPVEFIFLSDDGVLEVLTSPLSRNPEAQQQEGAKPAAHENPYLAFAGRFANDPFRDEIDAYLTAEREREREEAARAAEAS